MRPSRVRVSPSEQREIGRARGAYRGFGAWLANALLHENRRIPLENDGEFLVIRRISSRTKPKGLDTRLRRTYINVPLAQRTYVLFRSRLQSNFRPYPNPLEETSLHAARIHRCTIETRLQKIARLTHCQLLCS